MDDFIKANEEELVQAVCDIIKIKSVKEEPKEGMPFGEGPAKALQYALGLAESFGLETKNLDNYAGWAQLGSGDEIVGVLVHLDVVPEGSGWSYPPYGGEICDGKIYGRGAIDNKGPAMTALFALKTLKDAGAILNKRVRVIFGTDEESDFECMKYYKTHDEPITMGFSPDASYPIINGEKGILTFSFAASLESKEEGDGIKILSIKGGTRPNMVPDYAEAVILGDIDEVKNAIDTIGKQIGGNFEVAQEGDKIIINSYGISAHASRPETGENAIMLLVRLLGSMNICGPKASFVRFLDDKIGLDTTGCGLGVDFKDEISGPLTLNVGIADIGAENAAVTINIRYPIKYTGDMVISEIREHTSEPIQITDIHNKEPHYVPEDNILIQKLKKAYEKVTGEKAYCFTIGGGTYARMFDNCVAFGPSFPDDEDLAHQKDEYIKIDTLFKNLRIYTYVLKELAE